MRSRKYGLEKIWLILLCDSYAVCCSLMQCVTLCRIVLQCVAVCCSVLQCLAVCCTHASPALGIHYALKKIWLILLCDSYVYMSISNES